jgi:hypothetical protein
MRWAAGHSPHPNGQGGRKTPLKCPGRDPNAPKRSRFRPRMRRVVGDALSPGEKIIQHSPSRLHPIGYSIPCHSLLYSSSSSRGSPWLGFPAVPSSVIGCPTPPSTVVTPCWLPPPSRSRSPHAQVRPPPLRLHASCRPPSRSRSPHACSLPFLDHRPPDTSRCPAIHHQLRCYDSIAKFSSRCVFLTVASD